MPEGSVPAHTVQAGTKEPQETWKLTPEKKTQIQNHQPNIQSKVVNKSDQGREDGL